MEWYLLAMLSAIFLSAHQIIKKRILKNHHSLEFLASVFLLVALFQFVFISNVDFASVDLRLFLLIFVRACLIATGVYLLTRAQRHMEISSVSPLSNISPVFLLVLSYIFLGERVGLLKIVGVFLIVFGSYFLRIHDHYLDFFFFFKEFSRAKNKYVVYVFASLLFLSISAVLSKVILSDINVYTHMFFSYTFIAVVYLAILFIKFNGIKEIEYSFRRARWWVPVLAVLVILSDFTYFSAVAIPSAMVALVVPIRRLSSLFSTVIGGRMFHEHYLLHKIISTFVLLAGAFLVIAA